MSGLIADSPRPAFLYCLLSNVHFLENKMENRKLDLIKEMQGKRLLCSNDEEEAKAYYSLTVPLTWINNMCLVHKICTHLKLLQFF